MNVFVVACEDAGGAAALAPVVRRLVARGDTVRLRLGPVAARIFTDCGITVDAPVVENERDVRASIEDDATFSNAAALLTATSAWGTRLEARAIRYARTGPCPSLSVIDFWSNYAPRLSLASQSGLDAIPDRIAAIDLKMRDELVEAGVPSDRVVVTGSPAFDSIVARRGDWKPSGRRVLFLSQPIAALYGSDESSSTFLGYTERTVLAALAPVVAESGGELVIRCHPREDAAALASWVSQLPGSVRVDGTGSLASAIDQARLVVGMTTMALVEAGLVGAPTISAQLGRLGPDMLPTNDTGLTHGVTEAASLRQHVLAFLDAAAPPSKLAPQNAWPAGATERVIHALETLSQAAASG